MFLCASLMSGAEVQTLMKVLIKTTECPEKKFSTVGQLCLSMCVT